MRYGADYYPSYDELSALLHELADAHPRYLEIRSLGSSPEGRQIWMAVISDLRGGPPENRPALWVDANLHASELMGSAVALHTIDWLMRHVERDEHVAQLVAERTLYLVPRANPDGAEYVLQTGLYLRSAPRLYPEAEPLPGFVEEDLDGDGEVLQMRVIGRDGAWRVSEHDDRLLVPRRPWDTQGPFYHLYREGCFSEEAWRQPRLPVKPSPHGLDFNRNFPAKWVHEAQQKGAGPYPLSEPEPRALVDFVVTHPNICGVLTLHTYSGVLLRPFSDKPDAEMPLFDRRTYDTIGARCEELTGFACKSTYHDFNYTPGSPIRGVFDDWAYESQGVHAFTLELWSPWRHAGLDFSDDLLRFFRGRTEEEDLALLRWSDEALEGQGFERWRPFDHPQLGPVEIGGWRWLTTWRNAPPQLLPEECERARRFVLDFARCGPRPRLELGAEVLGQARGLYRLTARVINEGWLPTDVTALAREHDLVAPTRLELTLGSEQRLIEGDRVQEVEHLDGQASVSGVHSSAFVHTGNTRGHLREYTWIVEGKGALQICWRGPRIGQLQKNMQLG